jgi:hypothetical protein
LDQLRMVLQADEKKESAKKSELTVARELFQKEGIAGFYKGLLPVLAALATSNFIYFYTYNALKTAVIARSSDGKISAGKNLIVASIAGWVNVLATCPLWVASTRLKLQANPNAHGAHGSAPTTPTSTPTKADAKPARKPYTGVLDALVRVGNEEGVRALWGGTVASLVLVINPTIQFAAYEQAKQTLTSWRDGAAPSSAQIFAIAAYSKSVATLLTYPLQLIQTRMRSGNKTMQVVLLTLVRVYCLFILSFHCDAVCAAGRRRVVVVARPADQTPLGRAAVGVSVHRVREHRQVAQRHASQEPPTRARNELAQFCIDEHRGAQRRLGGVVGNAECLRRLATPLQPLRDRTLQRDQARHCQLQLRANVKHHHRSHAQQHAPRTCRLPWSMVTIGGGGQRTSSRSTRPHGQGAPTTVGVQRPSSVRGSGALGMSTSAGGNSPSTR